MPRPDIIAIVPRLLSKSEWRQAVTGADFIVPLSLEDDQPDAEEGLWHASAGGEAVTFRFAKADAPSEARERADLAAYRHLVSTPDGGDVKSLAVALAGFSAYVNRTDGLLYDETTGQAGPPLGLKRFVDSLLAGVFRRMDAFYARYPEERDPDPGPMVIHATLHRG